MHKLRALLWPASDGWARVALVALVLLLAGALLSGLVNREGWGNALRAWYGEVAETERVLILAVVLGSLLVARHVRAFRNNREFLKHSRHLRKSEARFRSLVQHGSDIILILDEEGKIQYISPSLERVTGVRPEEIYNAPLMERIHPDDREAAQTFLQSAAEKPGFSGTVEVRIRHADGSSLYVEAAGSNQFHNPNVRGIVINARDITDRKMLEAELVWQANHDALTGLANRKLFLDELEAALLSDGADGNLVGVFFLDLDGFKQVNDELGHTTGDRLLTMIAERLLACANEEALVARLGGDEFTVLLKSVGGYGEALDVASRIQESLDKPYSIDDYVVTVSPSIGIALGTPNLDAGDDVLRRADTMMFRTKALRRSSQKDAGMESTGNLDDEYTPSIPTVTPERVRSL